MAGEILVSANKVKRRKKTVRITSIVSLILFIVLTLIFAVLSILYRGGNLTILLDRNKNKKPSLVIYEDKVEKSLTRTLYAEDVPFMDNISIKWLPDDIDTEKDGSHNGDNYIAYSFYAENTGKETINYWYEVAIDNVIKRVDDAVRIMIFVNGDKTVYAKKNGDTKEAEPYTTPFYEGDIAKDEKPIIVEHREKLEPNKADRITIVVWLEGDDPDCVNAIIGGEIKMHMTLREEKYTAPKEEEKEEKTEEEKKDEEEENKEEVNTDGNEQ